MSLKENMSVATDQQTAPRVKPEPQETRLKPLSPSSSLNKDDFQSMGAVVKPEPTNDEANARAFTVKPEPTDNNVGIHTNAFPSPAAFALALEPSNAPQVAPTPAPQAQALVVRGYTRHDSAAEIVYTPEDALKQGHAMVQTLRDSIKKLKLGSKLREEVWERELQSLQSQTSPKTLIAVCGATGAGKSSILNAILDDNVVPTSGMRACTAVVTEIAYHDKRTIDADVSFLSYQEWKQELSVLLTDLVDEDGNLKRSTDLKSDAGVAWQKVHALYPNVSQEALVKISADQIIALDNTECRYFSLTVHLTDLSSDIAQILGTTKTIVAPDSKTFAKEIARYIDSKDQSRGKKKNKEKIKEKEKPKEPTLMEIMRGNGSSSRNGEGSSKKKDEDKNDPALWPLIKQVNVRCNSDALSTGAILVDLPGVADANAARNNIAKDYMKKAACIWILAPITRAVDDKTARDLLGDAFKLQLMMDGNYDAHTITFIASKCDDISCSEVIRALQLEDDPTLEGIEDQIQEKQAETNSAKAKKAAADNVVKTIESELRHIRAVNEEYETHLEALRLGEEFTPKLTAKGAKAKTAKRKNKRGGKKGSPKRRRSTDPDLESDDDDIEMDSDSDLEEVDEDSDNEDEDNGSGSGSDSEKEDDDAGNEEDDEPVTEESIKGKIKEMKEKIKEARGRLNDARAQKKSHSDKISKLSKALAKLQRDKNALCSLKRSEFSRDVLKEDFRTGLKDLDDAAAEERDPEHFDPTQNIRDYEAIDLPVFTCSSRDYVRIKGQVKGDGEPTCFTDVNDTGVPALQNWCHQLTLSAREKSARNFLNQFTDFCTGVKTYTAGIGDVTAADRDALREKWESNAEPDDDPYGLSWLNSDDSDYEAEYKRLLSGDPLMNIQKTSDGLYTMKSQGSKVDAHGMPIGVAPRLAKEFGTVVDKCIVDLQELFKDGLEEKCHTGAANASAAAVDTSDGFAATMHWATYRATLRRLGTFRRDLNAELLAPFTRTIATAWGKVFENDLFAPFEAATTKAIDRLINEVEASAAPGLKDRVRAQGELCFREAKEALKRAVDAVSVNMQSEQKEVSRCLAPQIQEALTPGYNRAMEERGTGSVARQKAYFHGFIHDNKDSIFDDGADVLMERLKSAAESVGQTLDNALEELAKKIEVNLAVLWEKTRDDPKQVAAREELIGLVGELMDEIELWREAEKTKLDGEDFVARYLVTDPADEDVDMH